MLANTREPLAASTQPPGGGYAAGSYRFRRVASTGDDGSATASAQAPTPPANLPLTSHFSPLTSHLSPSPPPTPSSAPTPTLYQVIFTISTATGVLALLPQVTMFSANFGLLVIIFENLLYDLWRWLAILVFFVSAFSILFVGLFAAGWVSAPDDDITHVMGPAAAPFWALFGSWNYDNFRDRPLYTPAVLVLFVYALFANLALVNLLIAMFSDTYATRSKEANIHTCRHACTDTYMHCMHAASAHAYKHSIGCMQ